MKIYYGFLICQYVRETGSLNFTATKITAHPVPIFTAPEYGAMKNV